MARFYDDRMMRVGRPVDWWRAGAWMTRAVKDARVARRLKRAETKAEKTEVLDPPPKPKRSPKPKG